MTEYFVFGKKKINSEEKEQLAVPHILSRPVCSGIEQGEWKRIFLKSPFHWSGPYMLSRSTRGLFWRSLWKAMSLSGLLFKECHWGSSWNSGEKISLHKVLHRVALHYLIKIMRSCVLLTWNYWEWPAINRITMSLSCHRRGFISQNNFW